MLVIDLEATCSDDDSVAPSSMEIIEVGAVWATLEGEILASFQRFVRPMTSPTLTAFCMELTHISQADVDSAPAWPSFIPFSHGVAGVPTTKIKAALYP